MAGTDSGQMRIRIVQTPPVADLDGISLAHFRLGAEYDVGSSIASVFLAEGWAEPVPLDDVTVEPSGASDPPNLKKEQHPPYLERDIAADLPWPRRRR